MSICYYFGWDDSRYKQLEQQRQPNSCKLNMSSPNCG